MNDDFLHSMRREPRPGFARALRERLREQDDAHEAKRSGWRPALAWAAAVAAIAVAFSVPAVRVSAQAMLDLFRVRTFAAVKFDPARFDKLQAFKGDDSMMFFEKQNVLKEPGPPRAAASLAAAGDMAGLRAMSPATLPAGFTADSIRVTGEGEASLVLHADKLQPVLDALDLRDVRIPASLDGRPVHVRMPSAIVALYRRDEKTLALVQSRSPEVQLPVGVDMAQLGEIGLRVLGLTPPEARRMARNIDWSSTLVVPVPLDAGSFREVTINGARGLLVTNARRDGRSHRHEDGALLMWATGDRVFALHGDVDETDLVRMAESVR